MKRVIVYGISPKYYEERKRIEKCLDDEYTIVGYSDGHYTCDLLDHKPFFRPEDICKQQVDFVLLNVKSLHTQKMIQENLAALGIPAEKIIKPSLFFGNDYIRPVDLIKAMEEQYNEESGLIFGLSYSDVGILEDKLSIPFFNCSWASLDLYYDFRIYNYMKAQGFFTSIDTTLWVFPYYYFDYDTSLASSAYYLSVLWRLNDWHHGTESPRANEIFENMKMFAKKWIQFYKKPKLKSRPSKVYGEADGSALLDPLWFSSHEATVSENKRIFVDFYNALTGKGGKVILVIPPFYLDGLNEASKVAFQAKKEKFYQILRELEAETGKIPIFDYADRFEGKRNNFCDLTHLNSAGAEEFTDILNNEILKDIP